MKHFSLFSFILFMSFGFFACKSQEKQRVDTAKKEVLALHDELMKKTEDLVKMRTELGKAQNKSNNPIHRAAMRSTITLINAAESFMEDWMDYYAKNEPKADAKAEDAIFFYEKQAKELNRMGAEMDEALEKGQAWLEKMNK